MPRQRPGPTGSLPPSHRGLPTTPCAPDCVVGENPPSVGRIRVVLRLAMALLVLLAAGIASPLLVLTPRRGRQALVRALFNSLLRAFGVRMVVHGRSRLVRRPGD